MNWVVLALLSAFILSLSNILQKSALKKEHSIEFAIGMFGVSSIILIPNFFFMQKVSIGLIALITLRAIFVSLGFLYFMKTVKHMDLSLAAPLTNLTSVFVFFLSMMFLGDAFSFSSIIGIVMIIFGTYVLQLEHDFLAPFKKMRKSSMFHKAALSAFFFACAATLTKYILSNDIAVVDYMHISFTAGFLFLLAIYGFEGYSYKRLVKDLKKEPLMIPLIALLDLASMYFYLLAVAVPAALIGIIIPLRRLSALFNVLIGGRLLHEKRILQKSLSTFVILVGVILIL